jgi:hypothetical protein
LNGTIAPAELNALQFNSTADNPNGDVNAYRNASITDAPYSVESKGRIFYLQDNMDVGPTDG